MVSKMATFGSWLDAQAGRGDAVGQVATAWRNAAGQRPRASAHPTITRWFASEPDPVPGMDSDRIEAVLVAALAQYHTGNHQAGPAVPAPPLGEDLQPARLQAVPGHQQPDQAGDGGSPQIDLTQPMVTSPQVMEVLQNFDERLAGLQELVGTVPAIHELLVAFMQAMAPLMELGREVMAAADAHPGPAISVAPSTMADQLGDLITPAQERARSVAEQNGWLPADVDPAVPDQIQPAYQQASQPADQGMRLYGEHIAPEPDWASMHDLGEPGDG